MTAMKTSTRRDLLHRTAGAVALGVAAAAGAAAQESDPRRTRTPDKSDPAARDKAPAEDHGPCELFAVVDEAGNLVRGRHAAAARRTGVGLYEVSFRHD